MNPKIFFDLAARFFRIRFLRQRIPLKVCFHITYRCNLGCSFCSRKDIEVPEMDTAQIKKMMAEFREIGTCFWVFNGGEPLLRADLGELIDHAKELGFHTSLVTNGTLLKERLKNEASFGRLDYVQLSLEGPKDVHDRMCGQGSYDKIMASLELLKIKKIKTNILALIAKQNLDFFDDIIKTASGFGASVVFQPIAGQDGFGSGIQDCVPEEDVFKKAVIKLIGRKKSGAPIASSDAYLSLLKDNWPHIPHGAICYAGRFFCNVDPEGNVVPCCSKLSGREMSQPGAVIGFKEAFQRLKDAPCCSNCYYFGPQEANIMLKLLGVGR